MLFGMKSDDINMYPLIDKLQDVLDSLDKNDLAIPAIKVQEAINGLKQLALDSSEAEKPGV